MFSINNQKPRNILMTADTIGGVWIYALELSKVLKPFGIKIHLATMGRTLNYHQRDQIEAAENIRLFESNYKLEWMQDPWPDVYRSGNWLIELEKTICPDLIHLNGYSHAALPWRAPKLVVGHSCVLSWWNNVKRVPVPSEWNRYRLEVSSGLNSAHCIVTPSNAMLDALRSNYVFNTPAFVVPNGRNPKLFFRSTKENFIMAAGRLWDEAKNIAALHACAPAIEWPVYIAGDETCERNCACPMDQVIRLGHLSSHELARWFSRASIYAAPALYEPFGLSILEAALSGCALVLGDIPSLREIWKDAALFVPPDNSDALANTISMLIRNPELLRNISNKAYECAITFTPEKMAMGYLKIYQMLLTERSRKTAESIS